MFYKNAWLKQSVKTCVRGYIKYRKQEKMKINTASILHPESRNVDLK